MPRRVIWDCLPEIGEPVHKLIIALKKHDWAHKKWRSRRAKAKQAAKRETHYDGPQPGPGEFSVACEVLGITAKEAMTDAKVAP